MTPEDHKLLAETKAGTLMGELLRRFWTPALLSSELVADGAPVRVQLLDESLIAFRDTDGRVGLLGEFCSHRGASLYFARNGECGLRCWYHGWKYNVEGDCLDMPNAPVDKRFADRVKQKSYPTIERNGVVWTYMGPRETIPPLPALEWLTVPEDHVFVSRRIQQCHWTQGLEGDIDSSHLGFLHDATIKTTDNHAGHASADWMLDDRAPKMEVEPLAAGLVLGSRRAASDDAYFWRINHWFLPGFTTIPAFPGAGPLMGHSWTPMEFGRTAVFTFVWHPTRALTEEEIEKNRTNSAMHARLIPGTFMPLANRSNDYAGPDAPYVRQPWMGVRFFQDQDMAATESMGPLYDRTQENLTVQDTAIVYMRRRLAEAARALKQGQEPPGRDPAEYALRPVSVKLSRNVNSWLQAAATAMEARPETFQSSV